MALLGRIRALPASGALRARPRLLAAAALLLVAGLTAAALLVSPRIWPAAGDAPPGDPQAVVDSGLFVLRLEGDLLSGEASDLVRALERTVGPVDRSFLSSAPAEGPLLATLPSGGSVGLVLVRPDSGDLDRLDAQVAVLLRRYPGVSAELSLPWSHAVVPPVRVWERLLSVRWLLLALLSSLLLYPVLETFSRAAHLLRSLQDGMVMVVAMASGATLAAAASGLLVASGVGHGPGLLPAALLAGMFGALLPLLWERQVAAAGEEEPQRAASASALLLALLLGAPLLLVGLLLASVPETPAFGAQMLQPAAAGLALAAAATVAASLRLLLRRPSSPRERGISVASEVLLALSAPLGRLLQRRFLAVSLLLLTGASVTAIPAAAGLVPAVSMQAPEPSPSVLLELSSRTGQVGAASAASFLEDSNAQPWLSAGRELFGAPAASGGIVFSFEADPSLSPAGLERALAGIPLEDGLLVRAVGGSYRAWGDWFAALPLASFSAALLVVLSAAAAAAAFGHIRFRFARAGLILASPALSALLLHAPDLLSGSPPPPMFLITFLACSLWSLLFAVEFARDCDGGSDGSAAAREAWVSSAPLALLAVPLALAVPGLNVAQLALALAGTLLLALAVAVAVGPRQSLRF